MAIKVSGTEVVSNTRELKNITSVDASTLSVLNSGIGTEATRGTLTKSFTSGETASITLSAAVSPTPVVSATKEISQAGVSSKGAWDVNSTASNYNRLDSAYNTTLTPSSEGWDITQASFNQSLNMSAAPFSSAATGEEDYPTGLYIRSDGLKMYVLGFGEDRINEFNLSTAWDISSASHANSLSIRGSGSGQDDTPEDVFFKPDGTKMYFVGNDGNDVNEYNLSTAWDISTASFNQTESVNSQEGNPSGIFFKPDGLKMYIVGRSSNKVHEYNLSTAWDISTKSFLRSLSFALAEGNPSSVFFKPDGLKMHITGQDNDYVYAYTLTTAWDISTAVSSNSGVNAVTTFSVAAKETYPEFLFFKPDGLKMYVGGTASHSIHEYNLPVSKSILVLGTGSFAAADIGKTIAGNGGVAGLTAADGSYVAPTAFTDSSTIAAGSWSMNAVTINATNGLEMSNVSVNAWDVSTAVYGQNFSVSGQDGSPRGISFKPDGTKMYIVGYSGEDVNEYNLGTAWDVSTAVYGQNFSVTGQDDTPAGIFFKPDGLKMYIVGDSGNDVNEYNLSTAWDISTSVYSQNFSVSGQDTNPAGIFFKPDGLKMYIAGANGNNVNEYNLSTAWDISTSVYNQNFSVSSQESYPLGVSFKPDGTKMYIFGETGDDVNEYNVGTAWDISTSVYVQNFSVAGQDSSPSGIFFKPDGLKMYIVGRSSDKVHEYGMGSFVSSTGYAASITNSGGQIDSAFWTDINSMTTDEISGAGAVHYAVSTDNHTTWSVIKNGSGVRPIVRNNSGTWQYNSAVDLVGWDISSASFLQNFSVSAQEATPNGLFFKPDGTKMYVIGYSGDDVNEYNLSTAWDISTSVYGQNFSVAGEDNQPKSIFFKPDGLKMYVIGGNGRRVHEYNLSTAWDVSTASNTQNFSVYSQESEPNGLFFKPDGTKMYISGYSGDDVNEYNVSTAWDISTASFLQNFSVASQETVPNGIFFKPDGTKMYVIGYSGDAVYEYNLSTAWNVSTSVYLQNFSVAAQESNPANIFFKPDGLKMYLIGFSGGGVQEYDTRAEDYITSATWTSATTNSELYALQQALTNISINRMDKAQLQAITDTNHYTLGDSLDLMIGFYLASSNSSVPSSDGVSINYDATALNQGAVLGTDYNYDFPDSTTVRVTSSAAQNLKVRVV